MKRSKWSLEQEEKAGKKYRNEEICWLVKYEVPQAIVARYYKITRQRVNQIIKRNKKDGLLKRLWDWIKGVNNDITDR